MKRYLLAFAVCLFCSLPAFVVDQARATNGQAVFTIGDVDYTFTILKADVRHTNGITTARLDYSMSGDSLGNHLVITLMVQKPGEVDFGAYGNGITWYSKAGTPMSSGAMGRSRCTMSIDKLTDTAIEGKADCPELFEMYGGDKSISLTGVAFSATAR